MPWLRTGYDEMGILTDLIENGIWDEAGVAKMFRTIDMTKEGHQMTLRKKIATAAKSRAPQAPQVNVVPLAVPAAPEGEAELFVEAIAAPPVEVSQRKKREPHSKGVVRSWAGGGWPSIWSEVHNS